MAKKATARKPNIKPEHDYHRFPPLAQYIDRIGAEQLHFNRFMVKEFKGGYYTEVCLIKIQDGNISCSIEAYDPTDAERTAIKAALADAKFPTAIGAKTTAGLKRLLPPEAEIYCLTSRSLSKDEGNIVMVQQRIMNNDGSKNYVPWTFFSDGEWRRLEPGGDLPFWKPEAKVSNMIMVHEGAKAAMAMHLLTTDPSRKKELKEHPWGEFLVQYEHWGIIGGALAPHRADYEELKREKPVQVVYICDNDWNGKNVLQEFSRHYGGKMKGIMFDKNWKHSWDCADPIPEKFFHGKVYIGPRLEDLLQPATWATEIIPNPVGKGRDLTICRRQFREEWFHAVQPEVYIHHDWPNQIWTLSEFNNKIAPFSHVDDTGRLLKRDAVSKGLSIQYNPSQPSGVYEDANIGRFINTYCPSPIRAKPGDVTKFKAFMEHLIPSEKDRFEMLKWCATLIARPDIKMHYGVLLISEMQGVGKTTLGEKILAPLVGSMNVSSPNEQDIVESVYNYWIAHKRLAIVNEIYAGSSAKAYNKLKTVITDQTIQVMKKYQAPYLIENWVHIFACSNSKRALQISLDDRRWFVPKIIEKKKPQAYWSELNHWLQREGGLAFIANWAKEFVKEHGFVGPGQDAPDSTAKDEAIEAGMSEGMRLVAEFLDRLKEDKQEEPIILVDDDLVSLVRHTLHSDRMDANKLEKPMTLRKVAVKKGWFVSEDRITLAGRTNPPEWRAIKLGSRMICSHQEDVVAGPLALAQAGRKPTKVIETWERLRRI